MSMTDNSRERIGGNSPPDYAKMEIDRLTADYNNLLTTTAELLVEARDAPKEVNDEETAGTMSDLVVRMRSFARRVEGIREAEKEPHLRRGNACDNFFKMIYLKITRKEKNDPAGAADILHARVNDWNTRKLNAERERLAEIARKEEEEAKRLRDEQAERDRVAAAERQKQADAEAAAERARKAENIAAHDAKAEEHAKTAQANEAAAASASALATASEQKAEDARIDASRKPADHVRQRTAGGTLNTMRQIPEVKLVDKMLLDKNVLWPFLKDEHVEMALRAWAKTTSHKTQMDGAIVRMVDDTVIR